MRGIKNVKGIKIGVYNVNNLRYADDNEQQEAKAICRNSRRRLLKRAIKEAF